MRRKLSARPPVPLQCVDARSGSSRVWAGRVSRRAFRVRAALRGPVRPQARKLEDMVLMMAQKGQVQSQITDSYMKQMLEGISDGVRARVLSTQRTRVPDGGASRLVPGVRARCAGRDDEGDERQIRPPTLWRRFGQRA